MDLYRFKNWLIISDAFARLSSLAHHFITALANISVLNTQTSTDLIYHLQKNYLIWWKNKKDRVQLAAALKFSLDLGMTPPLMNDALPSLIG